MNRFYFMDPSTGRVEGRATNTLGEGGNFIALKRDREGFGRSLRGKATDGSSIWLVEKGNPERNFVSFTVDPITRAGQGPARSELALTNDFAFGERVQISMEFKIKVKGDRLDELTGYVLQFWQPTISPIAGVRVQDGRLEAVTRSRGGVDSKKLTKGWNNLEMVFQAGPNGLFQVEGDLGGSVRGNIDGGSQAGRATRDTFRPKFGWYGSLNPEAEVRFRHFELSVL